MMTDEIKIYQPVMLGCAVWWWLLYVHIVILTLFKLCEMAAVSSELAIVITHMYVRT